MGSLQEIVPELVIFVPLGAVVMAVLWWWGCLRADALEQAPPRRTGLTAVDLVGGLAIMLVGMMAAGMFVRRWLNLPTGYDPASLTAEQMTIMALTFQATAQLPVAVFAMWKASRAPNGLSQFGVAPKDVGRQLRLALGGLMAALPLVLATSALMVAIGLLFGQEAPAVGHELLRAMRQAHSPATKITLIASAVVVAPLLEETIFRGLAQTALLSLRPQGRRWRIVLAASLLFALVHAGVPWQVMPGLFVLGIVLGWLYERTGSLWPCVLVHAGFNAVNTVFVFVNGPGS